MTGSIIVAFVGFAFGSFFLSDLLRRVLKKKNDKGAIAFEGGAGAAFATAGALALIAICF